MPRVFPGRAVFFTVLSLLPAGLALALAVAGAMPAFATATRACTLDAQVEIVDGFTTGRELAGYSPGELRIYLRAFIDGLTVAPLLDAPAACMDIAFGCLSGLDENDMLDRLRTYLAANGDELDDSANLISFRALIGPCIFREDVRI